ncbi:hypothetical protein BSNK01_30420 [Bacillaceae bacterium]
MAVEVSRKQLIKSFNRHLDVYRKGGLQRNPSHFLMLFYAVECGLKAKILGKIKKDSLKSFLQHEELRDYYSGKKGHDLNGLLGFLKADRLAIPNVNLPGICFKPEDIHIAWRYGFPVPREHEKELLEKLEDISRWLEEGL